MISKRLFTLDGLNKAILAFPYKWSDKTNKPHAVPQSLLRRKTIGGNAHENEFTEVSPIFDWTSSARK